MESGIYQILSIIDNKRYIGQAFNIEKRWKTHISTLNKNTHKNTHLQRAWIKYGENNFVFSVIEYVESISFLDEREQYWIDFYNVCNDNFGYNINPIANSRLGSKFTDEQKINLSKSLKGRKLTDEHKDNIGKAFSKKVVQFDLEGNIVNIWYSSAKASKYLNIDSSHILKCCRNKLYTTGGYIWVYYDNYISKDYDLQNVINKLNENKIVQLDLNGEFIKEWNNANEVQNYLGLDATNILRACRGKVKKPKLYIWKFKKDYVNS